VKNRPVRQVPPWPLAQSTKPKNELACSTMRPAVMTEGDTAADGLVTAVTGAGEKAAVCPPSGGGLCSLSAWQGRRGGG
jgi:hypothetical protein